MYSILASMVVFLKNKTAKFQKVKLIINKYSKSLYGK